MSEWVEKANFHDGWYIVAAHGGPGRIAMPREDGQLESLNAAQYKRVLDNDPTWDGKMPLAFVSCETGPGFVRDLYELYDRQVSMCGPAECVDLYPDGRVGYSRLERDPAGKVRLDGSGNPIFTRPLPEQWLVYPRETRAPEGNG